MHVFVVITSIMFKYKRQKDTSFHACQDNILSRGLAHDTCMLPIGSSRLPKLFRCIKQNVKKKEKTY